MKLKELRQIASVGEVFVIRTDKDGREAGNELVVLPSQIAKYDEEEVSRIEAMLETSNPTFDGTIQVSPCLRARVVVREGEMQ